MFLCQVEEGVEAAGGVLVQKPEARVPVQLREVPAREVPERVAQRAVALLGPGHLRAREAVVLLPDPAVLARRPQRLREGCTPSSCAPSR